MLVSESDTRPNARRKNEIYLIVAVSERKPDLVPHVLEIVGTTKTVRWCAPCGDLLVRGDLFEVINVGILKRNGAGGFRHRVTCDLRQSV